MYFYVSHDLDIMKVYYYSKIRPFLFYYLTNKFSLKCLASCLVVMWDCQISIAQNWRQLQWQPVLWRKHSHPPSILTSTPADQTNNPLPPIWLMPKVICQAPKKEKNKKKTYKLKDVWRRWHNHFNSETQKNTGLIQVWFLWKFKQRKTQVNDRCNSWCKHGQ